MDIVVKTAPVFSSVILSWLSLLVVLIFFLLSIYILILSINFLRYGTKVFKGYLAKTDKEEVE